MNTKQAEAELKKVEEQLEFITQRRAELKAKGEQLSQEIASLNDAIGEALLMSRDASKEIKELQSKQTESAMIDNARTQADNQLRGLTMKRTEWQNGIARLKFDGIFETFEKKLIDTISQLYAVVSDFEELDRIHASLLSVDGISIDHASDRQRALLMAHIAIKGNPSGMQNQSKLAFELDRLEQNTPDLMSSAREKKSSR